MFKKIYKELVFIRTDLIAIRKELQSIRKAMEPVQNSNQRKNGVQDMSVSMSIDWEAGLKRLEKISL